jgi:hypothetical protein|tara:strand:+ start:413 stop:568 length:156 start_codon:yes stop_codon:yes gene_type:complete
MTYIKINTPHQTTQVNTIPQLYPACSTPYMMVVAAKIKIISDGAIIKNWRG